MARLGDSIRRHRGDVAVGEVDLRSIGYTISNRVVAPPVESVPADVRNLQQYTDWMKGLLTFIPDGRYELKSFATDEERKNVSAYAIFTGTHTGQGGPCPPTGKSLETDYVYVMYFDGDKIKHMQKIWHAGLAMKDLGWV